MQNTNTLLDMFKEKVHPKIKMSWKFPRPQAIQDAFCLLIGIDLAKLILL